MQPMHAIYSCCGTGVHRLLYILILNVKCYTRMFMAWNYQSKYLRSIIVA